MFFHPSLEVLNGGLLYLFKNTLIKQVSELMWCPRSVSDCPVVPSCPVVNAWTKLAPDVAAVSFERSNSRSREGSHLRRHGNFDWTTSSVDCGHSGNMGYLLDSGKPRSMSRFACLQQTLKDLPRKLDWKILQNLENHILAERSQRSDLWCNWPELCEATTTSCPLLLCLLWLGMKFVALLQHIWALNKRKLWSHTWRAGACSLASYLGNVASQHSFINL